jgi:hypothetical protein
LAIHAEKSRALFSPFDKLRVRGGEILMLSLSKHELVGVYPTAAACAVRGA